MTNTDFVEPSPETLIRDLHRIREQIVDSFNGDLHALTEDARKRQEESGRPIWRGNKERDGATRPMNRNAEATDSSPAEFAPIHACGALTIAEVLSAARLAPPLGNKIAMWIARGFFGTALVLTHGLVIFLLYLNWPLATRFALALAILVDIAIVIGFVHYWRSRGELKRLQHEHRGPFVETEGRIDEEGLFVRSENFEGSVRWHQYCGYRANEMVVVLYENYPSRYAILGRSKFASNVDWLRAVALVAEKLPGL